MDIFPCICIVYSEFITYIENNGYLQMLPLGVVLLRK